MNVDKPEHQIPVFRLALPQRTIYSVLDIDDYGNVWAGGIAGPRKEVSGFLDGTTLTFTVSIPNRDKPQIQVFDREQGACTPKVAQRRD